LDKAATGWFCPARKDQTLQRSIVRRSHGLRNIKSEDCRWTPGCIA
jgi:hypothetical protein